MKREVSWILKEKFNDNPNGQFKKDRKRLKKGEPVDYIIGFKEFLGCRIDLSKKPLIPRPETEFWVQKVIQEIYYKCDDRQNYSIRVLDMFAGSGCIGIAILKHLPNAKVVFADNSKKFLEQIKINCKINKIPKNRYKIIQSDVFSNITFTSILQSIEVNVKYDYIFANPPYIATTTLLRRKLRKGKGKNEIQESVLKYEPHSALFGGKDGLVYIRKFLAKAKNFLKPSGRIFMEFDSLQKKEIENLLEELKYKNWDFHKDQYRKSRYLVIVI